MQKWTAILRGLVAVAWAIGALSAAAFAGEADVRRSVEFTYVADVTNVPADAKTGVLRPTAAEVR